MAASAWGMMLTLLVIEASVAESPRASSPVISQDGRMLEQRPLPAPPRFGGEVEGHPLVYASDHWRAVGFLVQPSRRASRLPVLIYNRGGNRAFGETVPPDGGLTEELGRADGLPGSSAWDEAARRLSVDASGGWSTTGLFGGVTDAGRGTLQLALLVHLPLIAHRRFHLHHTAGVVPVELAVGTPVARIGAHAQPLQAKTVFGAGVDGIGLTARFFGAGAVGAHTWRRSGACDCSRTPSRTPEVPASTSARISARVSLYASAPAGG